METQSRSCGKNHVKTSGEPKESHAKDGKTSMEETQVEKSHGSMVPCPRASTKHKRHVVASATWEGIAERKNGHGNMWSIERLLERSATTEKHKSGEVIARRRLQSQEGVIFVCGQVHAKEIRGTQSVELRSRGKSRGGSHPRVAVVLPSRSTTLADRENTEKVDHGIDEV